MKLCKCQFVGKFSKKTHIYHNKTFLTHTPCVLYYPAMKLHENCRLFALLEYTVCSKMILQSIKPLYG